MPHRTWQSALIKAYNSERARIGVWPAHVKPIMAAKSHNAPESASDPAPGINHPVCLKSLPSKRPDQVTFSGEDQFYDKIQTG